MIERHEPKTRVDYRIDYFEIQPITFGNGRKVIDAGAAHRIGSDSKLRVTDRFEVDDLLEIGRVGR